MKGKTRKHTFENSCGNPRRILAVDPCSKGVAFIVYEEGRGLLDWGLKHATGTNLNASGLRGIATLLSRYAPGVLVTDNPSASHRVPRIRRLLSKLRAMAETSGVVIHCAECQRQTRETLPGTHAAIANSPLTDLLPFFLRKRNPWEGRSPRAALHSAALMILNFSRKN